jgi:cell wall-associated NlpC family hydrolase
VGPADRRDDILEKVKSSKLKVKSFNEKFAEIAGQWADARIPYRHRGTSRRGCDCTGLIIGICREMGFLGNYELRQYPEDWNLHAAADDHVVEELERFGHKINSGGAGVGDIAVMRFGRCPAHVGVIVAGRLMVHSFKDARCCKYAMLKNSKWAGRWVATYRLDPEKLRC